MLVGTRCLLSSHRGLATIPRDWFRETIVGHPPGPLSVLCSVAGRGRDSALSVASHRQPLGTLNPVIAYCNPCPELSHTLLLAVNHAVGHRADRSPAEGSLPPCKGGLKSHFHNVQWRSKVKSQRSVLDVGSLDTEQGFLKILPQAQGPDPGACWARVKWVPSPMPPVDGALVLGWKIVWGGGWRGRLAVSPLFLHR